MHKTILIEEITIENVTEKINESTGVKINAPMLVGLAFLFIFAFILAKSILSWVFKL